MIVFRLIVRILTILLPIISVIIITNHYNELLYLGYFFQWWVIWLIIPTIILNIILYSNEASYMNDMSHEDYVAYSRITKREKQKLPIMKGAIGFILKAGMAILLIKLFIVAVKYLPVLLEKALQSN